MVKARPDQRGNTRVQSSAKDTRGSWWWMVAGVGVLAAACRVVIAFTVGSRAEGSGWGDLAEIAFWTIVLLAVVTPMVLLLARGSRTTGIDSLRRRNPGAVVVAIGIMADQQSELEAAATRRGWFVRYPLIGRAVLTRDRIEVWAGFFWSRRAVDIDRNPIDYSAGVARTSRGDYPALVAHLERASGEPTELPMLIYRDSRRWIAPLVEGEELVAIVARLSAT